MNRREFSRGVLALGIPVAVSSGEGQAQGQPGSADAYEVPSRRVPIRNCDVVVAGGGTAGVSAAIAAARQGAKTVLIESKGYPGGTVVEGGTALHSYYNLWKAFPGVEKRQVVKGIPQEIVDRLLEVGGTTGHVEMEKGYDYDSVCTAIDTEMYKLVVFEMLDKAGVTVWVNTMLVDAIRDGASIKGVLTESRNGREAVFARCFVDATAYGDLSARAGADYRLINDHPVVNSIGLAGVSLEGYYRFMEENEAVTELAKGPRDGREDQIVRLSGRMMRLPEGFRKEAADIGMSAVTTTVHDDYFMFIKINFKMAENPTNRDAAARAELELRRRQARAVGLFRKYVPGCEKAFIARTSPALNIRRARAITCDYDVPLEDVLGAKHFDDDVMAYGFHDSAPRLQIRDGGTYGIPFRALRVKGVDNLMAVGMMITSDHEAHMSTRNTICCMGQGQAAGTAAALCAERKCGTRELDYASLRGALEAADVYFEG